MRPRVILHNAVSADGRTTGLTANLELFYGLASRWDEDVTLAGCDTILAALREYPQEPDTEPAPAADGAGGRLAVVDSRGRLKQWRTVKTWPFWRSFVSLSSGATPAEHHAYLRYQDVDEIEAGAQRVDLAAALEALADRYGARTVRVESGGTLNGALLREGLVDEVSLLLHPVLIGGRSPHTVYRTQDVAVTDTPVELRLCDCEKLEEGYVWLRYEVKR